MLLTEEKLCYEHLPLTSFCKGKGILLPRQRKAEGNFKVWKDAVKLRTAVTPREEHDFSGGQGVLSFLSLYV